MCTDNTGLAPGVPVPCWHWHRRLYDWVIHFADTPHGSRVIFMLSLAESTFFPVPPDVLLGPLALKAPRKWLRFAISCTLGSVIGGTLLYLIGFFLWSAIDVWVFEHLGFIGLTEKNFMKFSSWYETYDFWVVFLCGFTPLPYKACTLSAGFARINFPGFLVASAVGRAARFFIVAGLMGWKGEKMRPFIEKYFNVLSLVFVLLLIGGFAAIKMVD